MLKILHISNDFTYTKVHSNLYRNLDGLGIQQTIFHPLRAKENIGKNSFEFKVKTSEIIYSEVLKKYHKFFFHNKISFLFKCLFCNNLGIESYDLQHATTLFSDGALAYKIYKEYGIPYVVTLRNTDVNQFLLYRKDLYFLGRKILENAKQIFFLSPSLKTKFYSNVYFGRFKNEFEHKSKIINNGIDDFWLDNIRKPVLKTTYKFLYVGSFDNNKNVLKVIHCLSEVRKKYGDIELHLVGEGGAQQKTIVDKANSENWLIHHGRIDDKNKLLELYRESDFFVMASIFETFGLVYVEALSQGLPILYTKNQGIDGVFINEVGVAVNPKNSEEIIDSLEKLILNKNQYSINIAQIDFNLFLWKRIAKNYKEVYESCV